MKWFRKHPNRVDPEQLSAQAEKSIQETTERQPHVNALTNWLSSRKDQNGFGEDFEFTLIPRGAK